MNADSIILNLAKVSLYQRRSQPRSYTFSMILPEMEPSQGWICGANVTRIINGLFVTFVARVLDRVFVSFVINLLLLDFREMDIPDDFEKLPGKAILSVITHISTGSEEVMWERQDREQR
jgi:hypothetical protein